MGCRAPICLVAITDRRRMVAPETLAGGDRAAIARELGAAIAAVAAPGVLVQVREKDLDGGAAARARRRSRSRPAPASSSTIALDVALAAGADGVHLPERGLSIEAARGIAASCGAGDFTIGASCHSIEGALAAAAAGADLVQLGPIWDTPGKGPPLGPQALAAARAGLRAGARLVAVGGIDGDDRARLALRSGADAVAAIRAVWAHRLDLGRVLAGG